MSGPAKTGTAYKERSACRGLQLPAWEEASRDEYQAKTFVQGVTRARQLLAVVTRGG